MAARVRATIVVQPPSETRPNEPWSPSPVVRVDFTVPFRHRSGITAKAVLVGWHGSEIKGVLKGTATADAYFGMQKDHPPIYAPTEWSAYFCWEGLACAEPGAYRLRFEVDLPGFGKDAVESRFVLVWRYGGLGIESMSRPCKCAVWK